VKEGIDANLTSKSNMSLIKQLRYRSCTVYVVFGHSFISRNYV